MSLKETNPELFFKAVRVFQGSTPIAILHQIRYLMSEDPETWWVPFHFSGGMSVRNLFREMVCLDDRLPSRNWDEHYIDVIEAAVKEFFNRA